MYRCSLCNVNVASNTQQNKITLLTREKVYLNKIPNTVPQRSFETKGVEIVKEVPACNKCASKS